MTQSSFVEIQPRDFHHAAENIFSLIRDDWMLITAGTPDHFNTMTANWGSLGHLWHTYICTIFVRPQRYTYSFVEQNERFTLTFFDRTYRPQLEFCGQYSGRDVDKIAKTGLTPLATADGSIYFSEARLVLECRKIYIHDIKADQFLDRDIMDSMYPERDFHRMYIGQITKILHQNP